MLLGRFKRFFGLLIGHSVHLCAEDEVEAKVMDSTAPSWRLAGRDEMQRVWLEKPTTLVDTLWRANTPAMYYGW